MDSRNMRRAAALCAVTAITAGASLPATADGELQVRLHGGGLRISYALPLAPDTEFGLDRVRFRLGGLSLFETDLGGGGRTSRAGWPETRSDEASLSVNAAMLLAQRPLGEWALGTDRLRPSAWSGPAGLPPIAQPTATPYVGMRYSGTALRGSLGFFADVGMVMFKPRSTVRFGTDEGPGWFNQRELRRDGEADLPRPFGDWRLSPAVQLHMSYTF